MKFRQLLIFDSANQKKNVMTNKQTSMLGAMSESPTMGEPINPARRAIGSNEIGRLESTALKWGVNKAPEVTGSFSANVIQDSCPAAIGGSPGFRDCLGSCDNII
jgi:hypothetical protein